MTHKIKFAVAGFVILCLGILFIGTAKANPLGFQRAQTGAATTTVAYLTPGTATTTLIYDAGIGQNLAADSAVLLIQLTASSTTTTLKWKLEYSQDNLCATTPGKADWYSESVNNAAATASTTVEVRDTKEYSWLYASSTIGTQTAPNTPGMKKIDVPTPTRCVRAVFYLPAGSAGAAIWAEFVGKKQTP
jgi:hypothetical protein